MSLFPPLPWYTGEVLLGLLTLLAATYLYLTRTYGYWRDRGVVFIPPVFPFGSLKQQMLGREDAGTTYRRWYTEHKARGLRYVGAFTLGQPTLIPLDLELCRAVLTKDFHHFTAREFAPVTHEYISRNLFAMEGQEWKDMRVKLTPTFTSGKIKNMFPLMEKCAQQLQEYVEEVVLHQDRFDVKDLIARFTSDIIATCAFGVEVNSIRDPDNELYKTGLLIFIPKISFFFKVLFLKNFPRAAEAVKLSFFDPQITEVLTRLVKGAVDHRKRHGMNRNDFIDLMLKVKEDGAAEEKADEEKNVAESSETTNKTDSGLTLEEMTAQAFLFFSAGFETSASTTSFCLFELAKSPGAQDRLRAEVDEVMARHGGRLSYQALQEMTYMEQVLNETLRMYATFPFLTRVCTQRYPLPGSSLVLEEGVRVNVPVYAIHHDPETYPDPFKFDPDRFAEDQVKRRHPYTFLPFGEGPRICVGVRFAKLQVKLGLAALLSRYTLSLPADAPDRIKISPYVPMTIPSHPILLRISRREDLPEDAHRSY